MKVAQRLIENLEDIVKRYASLESMRSIGKLYKCRATTIKEILLSSRIDIRPGGYPVFSRPPIKICTRCKKEYPYTTNYFSSHGNKKYKDGSLKLSCQCKNCHNELQKNAYRKDPFKRKEQDKEYVHKNRDKIKAYHYQWVKDNQDKVKSYELKPKRIAWKKEWAATHKEKRKEYEKRHQENNIGRRIRINLSRRIRNALDEQNTTKTNHTIELIGCSIGFFKKYIEDLFLEGMAWDNYGRKGWHLDHIIPCASFDLTNLEEQKKCFHYSNQRPLWNKDNNQKSSIYKGVRITYKNRDQYKYLLENNS